MNYCGSCGVPVPKGQRHCSMCMGDVHYGKDGYYAEELRREQEREEQRREWEADMWREIDAEEAELSGVTD